MPLVVMLAVAVVETVAVDLVAVAETVGPQVPGLHRLLP